MIHRRESIADKTSDDVGGSPYERCWRPAAHRTVRRRSCPSATRERAGRTWRRSTSTSTPTGPWRASGSTRWGPAGTTMGRFLEQDPLGEVAGSNLYAYVDASPVMWVDPSGLMREDARRYWKAIYEIRLPGGGLSGKGVYGGYSGRPKPRTTAGWLHDELRARGLEREGTIRAADVRGP